MLLIRQADLQRLKMIVMGEKNMQNQYVGGEEVLFTSTVGDNNAFKNIYDQIENPVCADYLLDVYRLGYSDANQREQ